NKNGVIPMLELTASTGVAAVTGVTLVGLLSGLDTGVVIGAFAGAVVFVLSATEFRIWKRVVFFVVAFVLGILTAGFSTAMLSTVIPASVMVEKPIGALVSSATIVWILIAVIAKAKNSTFKLKGDGK
ncbi:MAG: putative holin, partial [Acinetobacter sp.]